MNVLLAVLCAVAAAGAVAAVLSVRVDDGIVGKLGLIITALALASMAVNFASGVGSIWRPAVMLLLGLFLAGFAPVVRERVQLLRSRRRAPGVGR